MKTEILTYNDSQTPQDKEICDTLAKLIIENLPEAEYKIWHSHPVWFLDENPIVGYHKLKDSVRILFWSGQTFEETGLVAEGSFKAAGKSYTSLEQIDEKDIKKWLEK